MNSHLPCNRVDLTFARNANGALQTVTDNLGGTRNASYTYHTDQRLASGNGPWGTRSYTYDAAGNLTQIVAAGTTRTINVAAANNRVTTVVANAVTERTFTYTAGGSVSVDDRTGAGNDFEYTYNNRGRLSFVEQNNDPRKTFLYDAFDQRVSRTGPGSDPNRKFVHDAEGRLWAEYREAGGQVQREYIWLDDMPVAMIVYSYPGPTVQTYFIHTGQIGEPLMLTDAAKATVWNNAIEPYGTATALGTDTITFDLRYPGQWLQADTGGLAQNWFRDYDASLARYSEADPMGVEGDLNGYAYAYGMPLSVSDPQGLGQKVVPVPVWLPPIVVPGTPEHKAWEEWAWRQVRAFQKWCREANCDEHRRRCKELCTRLFAEDRDKLPGTGHDWAGRWRRCVRECMKENGCEDF